MKTLTNLETAAIAGGNLIVVPVAMNDADLMVTTGLLTGFTGGAIGFIWGMESNYSLPGAALCGVVGSILGAFVFPIGLVSLARGIEYSYKQIGLI